VADWQRIEAAYRQGECSVRELARREGISEGAIRKRAKAKDWPTRGPQPFRTVQINGPEGAGTQFPEQYARARAKTKASSGQRSGRAGLPAILPVIAPNAIGLPRRARSAPTSSSAGSWSPSSSARGRVGRWWRVPACVRSTTARTGVGCAAREAVGRRTAPLTRPVISQFFT
jgi:hypothetical protein